MTTMVFRNGNWEESTSLEATHEVLTGQGVFETILVKDQVPLFLDSHLARLRNSSAIFGIPSPDVGEVTAGFKRLVLLTQGTGARTSTLYTSTLSCQKTSSELWPCLSLWWGSCSIAASTWPACGYLERSSLLSDSWDISLRVARLPMEQP
jgi:hypothetical protein